MFAGRCFTSAANMSGDFVQGLLNELFGVFFSLTCTNQLIFLPPHPVTVAFCLKGNGPCNFKCSLYPFEGFLLLYSTSELHGQRRDAGEYTCGGRGLVSTDRDPVPLF